MSEQLPKDTMSTLSSKERLAAIRESVASIHCGAERRYRDDPFADREWLLVELDKLRRAAPEPLIDRDHPEAFCERCQRPNAVWFAPSPLWNAAHAKWDILCPVCFIQLAEATGIKPTAWEVSPEESLQPEPERPDGMPEPSLAVLKRVAARMSPDTAYLAYWAVEQIEARAAPPPVPDLQMAMALISEVDCHLANAKWDKDATARRKLHQAHALLAPTKGANDAK